MIYVGICDDEKNSAFKVSKILKKRLEGKATAYKLRMFSSSKDLLYEIEERAHFDLLLLDVEMPELDGLGLTMRIKTHLPDVLVIFITSYESYVYEAFEVQPYRYILKDKVNQMLPKALDDAVQTITRREGKFYFASNQKGIEKIALKSIIYIWHNEKYAYIEKTDGSNVKVRKTLKQVYQELDLDMFEWLNRGCICNLIHISQIIGEYAVLSNGEKYPISRDRLQTVKAKLCRYISKN